MKRSTIIILSFTGLVLILSGIFIKLTYKYENQQHVVDIYEGFVVQNDSVTKHTSVYFKTLDISNKTLVTTDIDYDYKENGRYLIVNGRNKLAYRKVHVFSPNKNNSLPVKFVHVGYRIIYDRGEEYFIHNPIDTIPPYKQKTGFFSRQALLVESPVKISFNNDTIVVEKETSATPNSYSLLFENITVNVNLFEKRDSVHVTPNPNTNNVADRILLKQTFIKYFQGFYGVKIAVNKDFNIKDSLAIYNNMKSFSIVKPSGDIVQTYSSVITSGRKNLTTNWYLGSKNTKIFKELRFKKY